MSHQSPHPDLFAVAARCREVGARFRDCLATQIALPDEVVAQGLIALIAGGHLLLEGNPGTGKHTFGRTLARAFDLGFWSITMTEDLAAEDLERSADAGFGEAMGRPDAGAASKVEDRQLGKLRTASQDRAADAGILYAEDVEKASPRSRAALIGAMRHAGQTGPWLPSPARLSVIGSQRPPIGLVGGLVDPAQLDRFLFRVCVPYPTALQEWEIARGAGQAKNPQELPLSTAQELAVFREACRTMEIPAETAAYAWALVCATRPGNALAPDFVERWIDLGISPCGLKALVSAAKARALLHGRVGPDRKDVLAVAYPALSHRIVGNDEAKAANLSNRRLLGILLEAVPDDGTYQPPNRADTESDVGL